MIKNSNLKKRYSFLESSLKNKDFQLLPFEKIPPEVVEKTLKWQEQFCADYFSSKIAVVTTRDSITRDFIESLKIQSYQNFTLFVITDDDLVLDQGFEVVCLNDFEDLTQKLDGFEYILLTTPNLVLHPSALFIFLKQANGKNASFDCLYSNSILTDNNNNNVYKRRAGKFSKISALERNCLGQALFLKEEVFIKSLSYEFRSVQDLIFLSGLVALKNNYLLKRIPLALTIENNLPSYDTKEVLSKNTSLIEDLLGAELEFDQVKIRPQKQLNKTIGIVIPFKDEPEVTINCLKSILSDHTSAEIKICLISNNSSQDSIDLVSDFISKNFEDSQAYIKEINTYFNFALLCNLGAEDLIKTHGVDILLFLNNDVELREGNTIDCAARWTACKEIGAIGGELLYPDGLVQSSGISFSSLGPLNLTQGSQNIQFLRESDSVSFAFCMLRVDVWNKVGGLDEFYCPNGFGDALIGHEIKKLGYLIITDPQVKAIHYESKSRKKSMENLELWELHEHGIPVARYFDEFSNKTTEEQVPLSGMQAKSRLLFMGMRKFKRILIR